MAIEAGENSISPSRHLEGGREEGRRKKKKETGNIFTESRATLSAEWMPP